MRVTNNQDHTMASATKRCWKLQEFTAHSANVNTLALGHKSGRVLVTGGDDKKVNLWAVGKHNCFMSLSGHTTPVECVQFGHTDELVCAGSQSGTLKIWDLEAAKLVRSLTGHKSNIRCIDFHPYGDFLASGSFDTSVKLWDIRRKGCIFTYSGHDRMVNSLKFSPDGQWIASGGDEGHVKLWDLRAGRLLKQFSEHNGSISAVKFHPNEFLLAAGSADRTVTFWDLEKFQLISTSDKDIFPIRCISFSENGECLFAGSQESLRVYGWEPTQIFDTVPIPWGKIQDIALAQNQLIGASIKMTNVILHIVDLSKVQPFGGVPTAFHSPFVHGQSVRKSFSRDRPFNVAKARLDVKTIEESDRSGTDPEEDATSLADIKNVADYENIFQPNRTLSRTPPPEPEPFPAPPDDVASTPLCNSFPTLSNDPMTPQALHPASSEAEVFISSRSLSSINLSETSQSLPTVVRLPADSLNSDIIIDSQFPAPMQPQATSSPRPKHNSRRLNSYKDSSEFPEMDFPVKLSSIRHSPSEPALNRSNSSHSRSQSLTRNFVPINNSSSSKPEHVESVSHVPEKPVPPKPSALRSPLPQRPPPSSTPTRLIPERDDSMDMLDHEPQKEITFIPSNVNHMTGLDLSEFLPKNNSKDLTEDDVFRNISQGHPPVIAVLDNRLKCLQIVYSVWQNKDLKTAVESAINMNEQAIIVDVLDALCSRHKVWNLDVCVALLPCINELLQSKFERYMTVGCNALRLILKHFASIIKTNILAPIQTVGVDISREERYKKCLNCYKSLMTIRAFLLKRQTMQGKLGQSFRELHNLMQELDE